METNTKQNEIVAFIAAQRNKLLKSIRSRINNLAETDAEDLLQDVVFHLFSKADVTRPVENLAAYVYQAIRNKITDFQRKRKTVLSLDAYVDGDEEDSLHTLVAAPGMPVDEVASQNEFFRKFEKALAKLEPKQRAVWVATELEGESFRELATKTGEPIGTLLARKHRATRQLQQILAEYRE